MWVVLQWVLVAILLYLVHFLFIAKVVRHYFHFPIPGFLTQLIDNPIRRRIQRPEVLAERMKLKPGMIVVEVGPGKGNYTKAVAEKILPGGKVYAIDIQESVIERLKKRIEKWGITNIIPKIDDAYNLSFANQSVDRILAICTLAEIPEPVKVLREFHRVLKPDGLVCLSEMFLDPDYPRRITEKRWASEAGFELREEFGNFFIYQLNLGKKSKINQINV